MKFGLNIIYRFLQYYVQKYDIRYDKLIFHLKIKALISDFETSLYHLYFCCVEKIIFEQRGFVLLPMITLKR